MAYKVRRFWGIVVSVMIFAAVGAAFAVWAGLGTECRTSADCSSGRVCMKLTLSDPSLFEQLLVPMVCEIPCRDSNAHE